MLDKIGRLCPGKRIVQMKTEKDKTRQVVGYARVSTTDQTIALQKDNLETYGCNLIIEDVGVSGGIHPFKRSNFVRTIEGMSEGSTLVVWKLDRLGRSLRGILDTFDFIQERGIEFVSLTESIQTNTVMGKAFLHFLGLLSELERGLIKERTIHGLAAARKRGQRLGRPFALESEVILEAHAAIKSGHVSRGDIAKKYGVSDRTLRRGFDRLGLLR